MKRLLVGLMLLVALGACAQSIVYKSQATLEWDAVTTDTAGQPLLPGDTVAYEVYIYDYQAGVADPQNVALLTYVGTTSGTSHLITFPRRTVWAAGVRVRLVDGGGNLSYSAIAWSDVPADAGPDGPFVYSPSGLPRAPRALRDAGM